MDHCDTHAYVYDLIMKVINVVIYGRDHVAEWYVTVVTLVDYWISQDNYDD